VEYIPFVIAAGSTRRVSRPLLLLFCAAALAGCGGGGSAGGTTPGQGGGGDGDGSQAQNPRVRAVLDCLESAGGEFANAYELESNAISIDTEANGAELHFLSTPAKAKKLGSDIEATGIGQVFVKGTVVENWSSPPTPDERGPVTKCLAKDPGP
jgi:ABC-type phosphate transport system substrate-binding protein